VATYCEISESVGTDMVVDPEQRRFRDTARSGRETGFGPVRRLRATLVRLDARDLTSDIATKSFVCLSISVSERQIVEIGHCPGLLYCRCSSQR